MIQLDIVAGPGKGASFRAEEASFIIGRGRTNRVILVDAKVSARHAQVECRGQQYVVRDLGSTNGTFVNGRAMTEETLQVGDEVRVGQTVLRVAAIVLAPVPGAMPAGRVSFSDAAFQPNPVHARVPRRSAGGVLERATDETATPALVEAYRHLLAMYKVSGIIRTGLDIDQMLDEVLSQVFRNFRAERGVIMLFDDETGELVPRAFRSRVEGPGEAQMTISRTIVHQVIDQQEAVLTSDATLDERFSPAESIVGQHIRSAMCAPLGTKQRVLGIIYVDCRTEAGTFRKADLELLTAIANEAGMAVENRLLREANIKAERLAAVGQAVAGLSHHIKNILTCMTAGSEIVQHALEKGDLESIRKGWGIVSRNERRIAELVLDMLSYSTDRAPGRVACNVNNVIEDVMETIGPAAEAAGVSLAAQLAPDLPTAMVDPAGVHRCVLNLVTNAFDAVEGRESPAISIATAHNGENVVIHVSDNGHGIPPEIQPKVFDIFFSTKGERGTGLGLAVVKKIVTEHAGEISLVSEPGAGATFRIALPINPAGTAPASG